MAVSKYSDFLKKDKTFEQFSKDADKMEANFTSSIKAMEGVAASFSKNLKTLLASKPVDTGAISQLTVEVRNLTTELNATKKARRQVNSVKKKFIDLSREEQHQLVATQEKTKALKAESRRLYKEQVSGIGTLKRLRAEINRDEAALEEMTFTTKKGRKEMALFSRELKKKKTALKGAEKAIGKYSSNVGNYPKIANAAASATRHLIAGFGLYQGLNFARSIFNEIKAINSLNLSLNAVTKTQAEFNAAQILIRSTSQKYGIDVNELTKSYIKFIASTRGSKISLDQAKVVFDKVTKSTSLLGATSEETSGVFKAFSDILSKGSVQMEELKGQLGDRLPGVLKIMSNSLGLTTASMIKLIEAGELGSEAIIKLAAGMEKAYGADKIDRISTLAAEQERLNSKWKIFIQDIDSGDGSISRFSKSFLGFVSGALDRLSTSQKSFSLFSKILGETFLDDAAHKGLSVSGKELNKIHLAINSINSSFSNAQKQATSDGGLEIINKQIDTYQNIIDNINNIPKSEIGIVELGELKVYEFQIERLKELITLQKEDKILKDKAKKEREEENKAAEIEKQRAKDENFRLPKMKEISQENKFQIEDGNEISTLYSEHEQKLLAIADAHKKATESANISNEEAKQLEEILNAEKLAKLQDDAREGIIAVINAIDEAREAAYQRNLSRLEREGDATQRSITDQRNRARDGLKNQLAFEERELAKNELKKQRLHERNLKRQKISNFFNTLNSLIEAGKQPHEALFQAGAQVFAADVFAASLKDGGLISEAISSKGGASVHGAIDNGYVRGKSHESKSGGIPVLMEGDEGVISGAGMSGFESSEQFKGLHSYLKNGGKYNDLINSTPKVIVKDSGSSKEVVSELRALGEKLDNIESQNISADFLSPIPKVVSEVKRLGKVIERIEFIGGQTSNNGRTSTK